MKMLTPLLSEKDPATTSEGSIDPLGLYAIADSLAVKLIPGVRERQKHPRFLTAIAVSLYVTSNFEDDIIAADRISEPWQVFEWCLVYGLIKTKKANEQLGGVPGSSKVAETIKKGVPLNAANYLKAPGTFGFHGVYRVLSRTINIEEGGHLGSMGYELLNTWAIEQKLTGFCGSAGGLGSRIYNQIVDIVKESMNRGAIVPKGGMSGWEFFRKHLSPRYIGRKEAKVLKRAFISYDNGYRKNVLDFLVSSEGQKVWENSDNSEQKFHRALISNSDSSLKDLLYAIIKYEKFSYLMQNAFNECLFIMSKTKGKTNINELISLKNVNNAVDKVWTICRELPDILAPFNEEFRFNQIFKGFEEKMPVKHWVEFLLEHHRKIQLNKPPNGKAPWFERLDDGSYIIRPAYVTRAKVQENEEYVNAYRTVPLWSFAQDLRMVKI